VYVSSWGKKSATLMAIKCRTAEAPMWTNTEPAGSAKNDMYAATRDAENIPGLRAQGI